MRQTLRPTAQLYSLVFSSCQSDGNSFFKIFQFFQFFHFFPKFCKFSIFFKISKFFQIFSKFFQFFQIFKIFPFFANFFQIFHFFKIFQNFYFFSKFFQIFYEFFQILVCLQQKKITELLSVNERPDKGYIPQCDSNGQFETRQCSRNGQVCWCVDTSGTKMKGTMGPFETVVCDGPMSKFRSIFNLFKH